MTATVTTVALTASSGDAHARFLDGQRPLSRAPAEIEQPVDADPPLLDACPLAGPATFEDSWGWARSGGRSHEGVDMIAERGTPVIAVRDGDAIFKTSRLGGRAVWITADNGDRFYYAHLDGWEGESRRVEAGEAIGYVGSSGNARGPHLHFETLPGNNVENPYPHTFRACVPDLSALAEEVDEAPTPDRHPRQHELR
jgi:murein DD-endopeptidase MepM/ murein hydrolase activator NlpD